MMRGSRTPYATILVPTHDHSPLIGHALDSILRQDFGDLELFVVGDGAPPQTREIVEALARTDPRVRYFDFTKGERHGEANRHAALEHARGRIVAYCGDDDLWFADHLATMAWLLRRADFAHTTQVDVRGDGSLHGHFGRVSEPALHDNVLTDGQGFFGLTVAGHRLDAYRRLPEGWAPAPARQASDQTMFRKFIRHPGMRFAAGLDVTTIHFSSPERPDWTMERREAELAAYHERLSEPDLRREFRLAAGQSRRARLSPIARRLRQWRAFAERRAARLHRLRLGR